MSFISHTKSYTEHRERNVIVIIYRYITALDRLFASSHLVASPRWNQDPKSSNSKGNSVISSLSALPHGGAGQRPGGENRRGTGEAELASKSVESES